MTVGARNPKVDASLDDVETWKTEFEALRAILLQAPLTEELKWGVPCYTFKAKNVVLIHGFKDYCALLFFKGALMADPEGVLVRQTENVQAARQIRFADVRDIKAMDATLKAYVREAVELESSGAKVKLKTTREFGIPEEFQKRLDAAPALKSAFEALTPGRQRAYILHFSAPKQTKTREARIDKSTPRILDGKGLDD
jgi:uncharacterized protein YdeI (YjbR/CyaY-like superfamily)